MSDDNLSYGLLVNRVLRYGRDYLEVRVLSRRGDAEHPLNVPSWYAFEGKPFLDGLLMSGSVYSFSSDTKASFSVDGPEFSDVGSVGLAKIKGMLKTMTTIVKRIEKEDAREPGDRFIAFARGVDAKWVVIPRKGRMERSSYDENRWAWYGLTDGRNAYRGLIAEMVAEEQQRLDEIDRAKAPVLAITDDRAA